MEFLTTETFKEKIFDFTQGQDWVYNGSKPAIIDFYADWCGPCKMVTQVLEEIQNDFGDKIDIFKIDVDAETELAAIFGIRNIPSLLFVPLEGKPQMAVGALPKSNFEKVINEVLLKTEESGTESSN